MADNNNKEIEDLKRRVQELEAYVADKKRQQISFPVDAVSKDIIANL